jgi:fumarate hydratase class II
MHIATVSQLCYHLCPALQHFEGALRKKSEDFLVSTLDRTRLVIAQTIFVRVLLNILYNKK